MALELLTPVHGIDRRNARAESVHFWGSIDGSFLILAEISHRTSRTFRRQIYLYDLKIPDLQSRSRLDFLSDWLPQHCSFVEILEVTVLARTYDFTTKCPHGLRAGDFVRFRDLENHSQNAEPVMVSRIHPIDDKKFSITEPSHSMFIQPKKGSYVHLQPRFFPFQKLQQTTQLLSGTGRTKCLIVSKNPLLSRKAAWIETEAGPEKLRFKSGGDDPLTKLFPAVDVRVDCACFLPESRVEGHLGETFIALGCTKGLENRLYIYYRNRGGADFLEPCHSGTDVVLPAFTRFTPLPSDDAVDSDSVSPNSRSVGYVLNDRLSVLDLMLRTLPVTLFTVRHSSCNKIDSIQRKRVLVRVVVCVLCSFSHPFRCSLHVTVETGVAPAPLCKVKCFRSINEIRPTVSASKKPISNTPLRSTHPTFSSLDVMSVSYI